MFNAEYEIGLSLYNGAVFSSMLPGYMFLIISLVLSAILIAVLFFLKEKGEMAIACVTGGAVIVIGYFFYETVILNYGIGPAASEIPFNIIQVVLSAAIAIPIVSYLNELGILNRYDIETEEEIQLSDAD